MLQGPSFKNLFGYERRFKDGTSAIADENYIRHSILNPHDQIVAGYDAIMPTYQGNLKDNEITAIIEYFKTLSDKYEPPTIEAGGEAMDDASATQPATTAPAADAEGAEDSGKPADD